MNTHTLKWLNCLLVILVFPLLSLSQIFIKGSYPYEGWDLFWLAKAGNPNGAPETFSARGRVVSFNIDVDDPIMNATIVLVRR